jgi:hypothetical protein
VQKERKIYLYFLLVDRWEIVHLGKQDGRWGLWKLFRLVFSEFICYEQC